jgi:hypothetical protein
MRRVLIVATPLSDFSTAVSRIETHQNRNSYAKKRSNRCFGAADDDGALHEIDNDLPDVADDMIAHTLSFLSGVK